MAPCIENYVGTYFIRSMHNFLLQKSILIYKNHILDFFIEYTSKIVFTVFEMIDLHLHQIVVTSHCMIYIYHFAGLFI